MARSETVGGSTFKILCARCLPKIRRGFSSQVISHNLQETLHDITPLLHEAFSAEFAGMYGFVIGSAKLGMHSANYIFSMYSNDAKNQRTTG